MRYELPIAPPGDVSTVLFILILRMTSNCYSIMTLVINGDVTVTLTLPVCRDEQLLLLTDDVTYYYSLTVIWRRIDSMLMAVVATIIEVTWILLWRLCAVIRDAWYCDKLTYVWRVVLFIVIDAIDMIFQYWPVTASWAIVVIWYWPAFIINI